MAKDLVCGTNVKETQNPIKAEHNGKIYYFCSEICRDKFISNPDPYVSIEKTLPITHGIINESKSDRNIRLISGAVFIALALKTDGTLKVIFSILGFIAALTSITGFSFLYELLDINTNSINTSDYKPTTAEMIRKKRKTYKIILSVLIGIFLFIVLLTPDNISIFFLLLSLFGIHIYKKRINNIGIIDRIIRFVFGVILIFLAYQSTTPPLLGGMSMILSIFCIVTSVTGFSILYELLNINTRKRINTNGHIPAETNTIRNKGNPIIRITCFILGIIALSLVIMVGGISKVMFRFLGIFGIITAFSGFPRFHKLL